MSHHAPGNTAVIFLVNERDGPPVEEQPRVEVRSWRLFEAKTGARHLMMFFGESVVRVTSELAGIYLLDRLLVTASGRVYALMAPPERNGVILAMLYANATRVGLGSAADVSDWLWDQMAIET